MTAVWLVQGDHAVDVTGVRTDEEHPSEVLVIGGGLSLVWLRHDWHLHGAPETLAFWVMFTRATDRKGQTVLRRPQSVTAAWCSDHAVRSAASSDSRSSRDSSCPVMVTTALPLMTTNWPYLPSNRQASPGPAQVAIP